jgi:hypothetical protein
MKIQKTRKRQVKREQVKEFLRELRSSNLSFYKSDSSHDQKTTTSKKNVTPISTIVEQKVEQKVENNLSSLIADSNTLEQFKLFQEYLRLEKTKELEAKTETDQPKNFEIEEEIVNDYYEEEEESIE